MRRIFTIIALLLLSLPISTYSQSEQDRSLSDDEQCGEVVRTDMLQNETIFYRIDDSQIDSTYLSNAPTLKSIDRRLRDSISVSHLDSISLIATASPDGAFEYNRQLSQRRATSLHQYLSNSYPSIVDKLIVGSVSEDWVGFRRMVVGDYSLPNKSEVLSIVDSTLTPDEKEWQLKILHDGESWRYIVANILPYLRTGASAIFHYDLQFIELQRPKPIVAPDPVIIAEPEVIPIIEEEEPQVVTKPLVAIKTNLLFDVATVLNVSLEVPIRNHFSILGEWVFPWWTLDDGTASSKRHRLQLLYGNIEGRYWFGSRAERPVLTGWFAGLYAGGGKYDFEYDRRGLQGEFLTAGASAGYAHSINKVNTLRMEYSLSAGALTTDYRDYTAIYGDGYDFKWHPVRKSTNKYSYIGPTSVKVSLVWMLYYNKQKKGAAK